MRLKHPFEPLADGRSKVLILGSFPSIKSFEENFYYAHPRNAFWPIMETLFSDRLPDSARRGAFALKHGIALWDVYGETVREAGNSSDANLKELIPNDLPLFLKAHPGIRHVFCTGRKAFEGCRRAFPDFPLPCTLLPSTSPAYAVMSLKEKTEAYRVIKEVLDDL